MRVELIENAGLPVERGGMRRHSAGVGFARRDNGYALLTLRKIAVRAKVNAFQPIKPA